MALHKVKLAGRMARVHLHNEECRIIIEKAGKTPFVTEPGIFKHDNQECVRVPKEQIIVPLTDITSLEIPTTRFNPEVKVFMDISWED